MGVLNRLTYMAHFQNLVEKLGRITGIHMTKIQHQSLYKFNNEH